MNTETRHIPALHAMLHAFLACIVAACLVACPSQLAFAADASASSAGEEEPVPVDRSLNKEILDELGNTAIVAGDTASTLADEAFEEAHKNMVEKRALEHATAEGSATDYCIVVDLTERRTIIFKRDGDGWKVEKNWLCSVGAPESPTLLGSFEVGDRGYSFSKDGYTCYYYTQFEGNYLFHSVKYVEGTFDVKDGRLGEAISEGCVRLKLKNAKWIHDNIPWQTRVITYE